MELVVINHTTYGMGGKQSHNLLKGVNKSRSLWNEWESISQLINRVDSVLVKNKTSFHHPSHLKVNRSQHAIAEKILS